VRRFHLIELEDQPWFPAVIRDGGTDFLGFVFNTFNLYKPASTLIEDVLSRTGYNEVLDLCSGNGGPLESVSKLVDEARVELANSTPVKFILSDKFPNVEAYKSIKQRTDSRITYIDGPVDILKDNSDLRGLRTMFSAVHHFHPKQVRAIISKITESGMPLAFFDGGSKSWSMVLLILIVHPIMFLLFTPFIRPFKWSRLLFTYLIPIIPLYTIWDGIVSILRLHTPEQLSELAYAADKEQKYDWKHGTAKGIFGVSIAYLIGVPK
jgi:hypothetical protein